MPLYRCEYGLCRKPATRNTGDCSICELHLCDEHAKAESHDCAAKGADDEDFWGQWYKAEFEQRLRLLARINITALRAVASELRNGISCRTPLDDPAITTDDLWQFLWSQRSSGQNCHIDVTFVDGVTWIARIRYDTTHMPPEPTRAYVLRSEIATLKFLEPLAIPTPKVFRSECTADCNPIGAPYILMEKLPGSALDYYSATQAQRKKVIDQLAGYFLELEKHPLPCAGSLALMNPLGSYQIQGYALPRLFSNPNETLGPFENYGSAILAILRHQMDCLVQAEYTNSRPVDNYLILMSCTQNIVSLEQFFRSPTTFYLKHQDDKGDHILVDGNYNITGIIDWEWASSEPAELAFASPSMIWPYPNEDSLSEEEVAFADRFEKIGRHDISSIIKQSRFWQQLSELLERPVSDMAEIEHRFKTLQSCFAGGEEQSKPYAEWREEALQKWKDDQGLKRLLATSSSQ